MNVLLLLLFEVLHRFVLLTETDKKLPIWTSELWYSWLLTGRASGLYHSAVVILKVLLVVLAPSWRNSRMEAQSHRNLSVKLCRKGDKLHKNLSVKLCVLLVMIWWCRLWCAAVDAVGEQGWGESYDARPERCQRQSFEKQYDTGRLSGPGDIPVLVWLPNVAYLPASVADSSPVKAWNTILCDTKLQNIHLKVDGQVA